MRVALLALGIAAFLMADEITTIAGNGKAGFSATQINNPSGLTLGPDGALYFCDTGNHVVRRLDLKTRELTVIAGTGEKGNSGDGGPATKAQLDEPYDLAFDSLGNLYFVDVTSNALRRVDAKTKVISTMAKGFNQPHCVAISLESAVLVCDTDNDRIQRVDPESGVVSTFLNMKFDGPSAISFDPAAEMYLALRDGSAVGRVTEKFVKFASVPSPKSISYAPDYSMYVADSDHSSILNIDLATNAITTAVGTGGQGDGPDGDPKKCKLAHPRGVLAAPDGKIYISDSENHRIRMLVYSGYGRPE